ncbi:MAG TPA: type II secretion system protein [Phycisphaerales bacterium]|nr:type II secretion system protein [Phycisphaerales bacterium]
MTAENKKYGGFLLTELIVSLVVLGIVLVCLAMSLNGFRRFNNYQLVRQRCVAAAQAELDSITVTGNRISQENFRQLWPKLNVLVEKSDGTGQWKGLKLIKVKTKGKSFNKDVEIELSRYILVEGEN